MINNKIKSGALEALDKIKEAEDKARKIVANAREDTALKILQAAQDEARFDKEKSLKEARAKARKIRAGLITKAEEEAARIRIETQKEKEALLKKGKAARADAVKKVSEEMKK